MDLSMRIKGIAVGIIWAVWGLLCIAWDIDPADMGDSLLGGAFHLIWGVATLFGLFLAGAWFFDEGADMLAEWYKDRDGGGGEVP